MAVGFNTRKHKTSLLSQPNSSIKNDCPRDDGTLQSHISVIYQSYISHISVIYQSFIRHISVKSTYIYFHPLSSTFIHFHLLSSSFIHIHPFASTFWVFGIVLTWYLGQCILRRRVPFLWTQEFVECETTEERCGVGARDTCASKNVICRFRMICALYYTIQPIQCILV